jgi:hypothetical protein
LSKTSTREIRLKKSLGCLKEKPSVSSVYVCQPETGLLVGILVGTGLTGTTLLVDLDL